MKLSSNQNYPGYDELAARHAKVKLNGVEIVGVIHADEEKGLIVQVDMDEKGRAIADPKTNKVKTVVRRGFVSISLPDMEWYELQMRYAQRDHGP